MCVWQVAFFPVVKKDHVKCVHIVLRLQLRDEVLGCPKEDGDLEQCSVSAVPQGYAGACLDPMCIYINFFGALKRSLHGVVSPGAALGVAGSVGTCP